MVENQNHQHNMQQSESMVKVSVIWRGNKYIVQMSYGAPLKELGDELRTLTDVKAETMRLIVPHLSNRGSKLLSPFSDEHSCLSLQEALITEAKAIRMMGVSEDEVDNVLQDAQTNLRIAGFDEEERRLKQRMSYRSHATTKLPQGPYTFCDFRTLQVPGIELHPPASEALKRMHMLAADPGIVAIMNKYRWRVGIMTEMAPVGYVGVTPKCILGFNKNHGEEISLRFRTDDLKGFRKYESIKKTLLHELAHMVYSEHDENFYALDKQLNQEANSLDWTRTTGHTLSGFRHSVQYEDDSYFESSQNSSQRLGGSKEDQLENVSESSVAAAYRRLAYTVANNVEVIEVHEEPDPDDSGLNICAKPSDIDSTKDKGANNKLQLGSDQEPDPDDDNDMLETNPDGFGRPHILEPDPDDSGVSSKSNNVSRPEHNFERMEILDSHILVHGALDEPDPDDAEAKVNNLADANINRLDEGHLMIVKTMEDQACLPKAHQEPYPSESQGNEQAETDPHDTSAHLLDIPNMRIDEPDPDDELQRIQDSVTAVCSRLQNAIKMLRNEVNPKETSTVLQTLFKIIRNVIEHPDELKFKRLRKANPIIQRNVVSYKEW